jgi:hypothetical protein
MLAAVPPAKRARYDDDSAEAAAASRTATDPCVAETEAAATQINAGVIKKLTIKVIRCSTISIHLLRRYVRCQLMQHCITAH